MKQKHLMVSFFCFLCIQLIAQIGIGTDSPHPSAILDITSENKGLLIPRMTTAQRDAIQNPAEGLEIYSTTDHTKYFFNGTTWQETFSETYNAYYQIYTFDSPGGTGPINTAIQMGPVNQIFNSADATYSEIGGPNTIRILEDGIYFIELTGFIMRGGSNTDPLTARYILFKNNVGIASCYESLGKSYAGGFGGSGTNVGMTFTPLLLQSGDILTIKAQNVDGNAQGMNLVFLETMLTITKMNTNKSSKL